MKQLLIAFSLIVIPLISFGQFDFSTLPKYDCKELKLDEFESGKNYIFVIPDKFDTLLDDRVKRWLLWHPLSLRIKAKKETDLKPKDYNKKMWIAGNISDFVHFYKFNLPLKITEKGFQFDTIVLEKNSDAIHLMLENKIVIVGNSCKATTILYNTFHFYGFDFVISQDNRITYFGKLNSDFTINQIANINDIKKQNYTTIDLPGGNLFISKNLKDTADLMKNVDGLSQFILDYCSTMKIPLPDYKFPMYVHTNQEEISNVTAFWDNCGGHIYGLQTFDEVHVEGLNFGTFKHEIQHLIFNSIYNEYQAAFFSEGIVEYYSNLNNEEGLKKRLKIAKLNINIPNKRLIIGKGDFFGSKDFDGIDLNYGISGIFVKYIIDTWGLEKYKEFFSYINIEEGLQKTYNKNINDLIDGYREWIKHYKI